MNKKRYVHACNTAGFTKPQRRTSGKKVSPLHVRVEERAMSEVFNRYYRDQVAALYKAVQG